MLMRLIKLPFKILALPLMLACYAASLLVKLAANLSSYVLGPLMLFILGCGIYTIVKQEWGQTLILAMMEAACIAAMFVAVCVETLLADAGSFLREFIHS